MFNTCSTLHRQIRPLQESDAAAESRRLAESFRVDRRCQRRLDLQNVGGWETVLGRLDAVSVLRRRCDIENLPDAGLGALAARWSRFVASRCGESIRWL